MTGLCAACLATIGLLLQLSADAQSEPAPPDRTSSNAPVSLTVIDEAGTAHPIAPDAFAQLPQQTVKVTSHEESAEFSGASLVDLLKSCGVEFGEKLKGRRAPTVALLDATDGYRVVVSLVEIDPSTTDKMAIIASMRDGQPLSSKEGPYRLILPGEKREIRWIRNLQSIRVVNLKDLPLDKSTSEESHAQK